MTSIIRISEHLTWCAGLYQVQSMSGAYWWSADGKAWHASPEAARS